VGRVAAAFAAFALAAPAPASAEPVRARLELDVALTAGLLGSLAVGRIVQEDLAPTRCRWCGGNGLDSPIREGLVWSDPSDAAPISDVMAAAIVPVAALGVLALGAWQEDETDEIPIDLLLVAEAVSAAMFLNGVVKLAVGRQRPYATAGEARGDDDNLSFFSGHTALTFSTVVACATIASLRRRKTAPWILAIGLPLAAAVGWLRIAADRHWATDVGTGAVLGAAFGFAIPWVFHGPA